MTLPADYVAEHVELGWAVTGYGNQGDTVDIGIAVLEPTTSRNHTYVALTRGRTANHALIIDPIGTADPVDRLAEIIARPARAESALAVRDRLHRAAGVEPSDLTAAVPAHVDQPLAPASDRTRGGGSEGTAPTIWERLDRLEHAEPDRGRGTSLGL